jgi:FkbM family methyltransferase
MNAYLTKIREPIRRLTPRVVRNWIRQPKRSLGYLGDRLNYLWHGPSEVEVRPDWRPRCHPASRNHFAVFTADPVQAAELNTFIRYCDPGMRFLDVGAHYGLFSLAALHFGGSNIKVVAVEASANASKILKANLASNNATALVQVINAAMGYRDGTLEMLSTGPAGSDYFVSAPAGRTDTTHICQLSMPTVLEQTALEPTHVKIDVEGFEAEAISGAMDCLRQYRPILFLELHLRFLRLRGHDPVEILRQLRECGYTQFEEEGIQLSEHDLEKRDWDCRIVCRTNGCH